MCDIYFHFAAILFIEEVVMHSIIIIFEQLKKNLCDMQLCELLVLVSGCNNKYPLTNAIFNAVNLLKKFFNENLFALSYLLFLSTFLK